MQELIAEFESMTGPKSLLGRELVALQKEQTKQQLAFELAPNKMEYETSSYRRANMAIERFLLEWLPRMRRATFQMDAECKERIRHHEEATLAWEFGTKTPVDRRSEATIWMHFALERYRKIKPFVKRIRIYHPASIDETLKAWKAFRHELRIWKYARIPFDGSQAMASMFQFLAKLDLLRAVND